MAVEYVENFYSRFPTFYDSIWGIKALNSGRELAPEFLDLAPGVKLLEVGVGAGHRLSRGTAFSSFLPDWISNRLKPSPDHG